MARERGLDDQIDNDEELLNFELDDLSFSEDDADDPDLDDEIIELVDLVERGASEDITRDLRAGEWSGAGGETMGSSFQGTDGPQEGEDKEPDLDLSDLAFESDMETEREEKSTAALEEGILDAELQGLLQDEDDITLDFNEEDDLGLSGRSDDELSDADLQALLSEAGGSDLDDVDAVEIEPPKISDQEEQELELETPGETQFLHFKPGSEERIVEAEPIDLLDQEVEELGAETELEGEEETAPEADVSASEETGESELLAAFDEESAEEDRRAYREEALAVLSEERFEEIITDVVREAVERVARQTMVEVAERMIGEAIESLKRSLEAPER
jgi:hypothetical protein